MTTPEGRARGDIATRWVELFVALLQAYIFTLLSSVFIGLLREGAH